MSKRKKRQQQTAPQPDEPLTLPPSKGTEGGDIRDERFEFRDLAEFFRPFSRTVTLSFTIGGPKQPEGDLRAAVADQLAAIHADLPDDWTAPVECPPPPPELSDTYAVAFGSARKRCPHENSHSTLHARRERQCDDCGRYFTRKEWWER